MSSLYLHWKTTFHQLNSTISKRSKIPTAHSMLASHSIMNHWHQMQLPLLSSPAAFPFSFCFSTRFYSFPCISMWITLQRTKGKNERKINHFRQCYFRVLTVYPSLLIAVRLKQKNCVTNLIIGLKMNIICKIYNYITQSIPDTDKWALRL